jgi:hypothetical protein
MHVGASHVDILILTPQLDQFLGGRSAGGFLAKEVRIAS